MTTTMRLNLQHLNVPSLKQLDSWVAQQLYALGQARKIDEANVRLTRLANASPAFQVTVHLVTPGPDVHAETRDHTLRAALVKAVSQLRGQISRRAQKQSHRWKTKLSLRAAQ